MRSTMIAVLAGATLIAGCGSSSPRPTARSSTVSSSTVSGSTAATTSTAAPAATHTGTSRAQKTVSKDASPQDQLLAFARCMRANGVTSFPDSNQRGGGGGGAGRQPVGNMQGPAFDTAQAKCAKQDPGGAPPGSGPPATAQTIAKLVSLAVCMRHHGVPQFPDPLDKLPSNLNWRNFEGMTDYDGGILLFPRTMNMYAPAFEHAQAACGSVAEGLNHQH